MATGCRVKYRWSWPMMRQSPHKIGLSSSNDILIRHSLPNSSRVRWCTKKLYHATTILALLIGSKLPRHSRITKLYHKSTQEKSAFFKETPCCKSTTQYLQVDWRKTTTEWCRCLCSTSQTHPWIVDSGLTRCKLWTQRWSITLNSSSDLRASRWLFLSSSLSSLKRRFSRQSSTKILSSSLLRQKQSSPRLSEPGHFT